MEDFQILLLTKDLIHCLNFAGGIIDKRTVKPILGHVKLDISENTLTVTSTSNDLSMKISINGQAEKTGSTTVNAATFLDIVRKINDEQITIKYTEANQQLEIQGSHFTSNLSTLPSQEFPALDDNVASVGNISIASKKILRLITCSEFAMSTEETRYNLNGIYLNSVEAHMLNATAIDGHRLSTISEKLENILPQFGIIIPRKTVFELIKILKDTNYSDLDADISFDARKISLQVGTIQIISKLVDATFPDYQALIPTTHTKKLSIHSKYLMEVVDRVASITHDTFRAIKFNITSDLIEISAFGETKGSARELIANTEDEQQFSYDGEHIIIGFNPKYLLDILKHLENNEIEIYFGATLDPILLKPVIYENDQYIIMPMKV